MKAGRQRAHRQARDRRRLEQHLVVPRDADRRMEFMRPPGQRGELRGGARSVGGLGKQFFAQRQRLVGAEDEAARLLRGDPKRLLAGEFARDCRPAGARRAQRRLEGALVDHGVAGLERNARRPKQRAARGALRGEEKRRPAAPERAHVAEMNFSLCSLCRSMIAAAVSSIDRRVTSIVGQPRSANSLRDCATSSATARWST